VTIAKRRPHLASSSPKAEVVVVAAAVEVAVAVEEAVGAAEAEAAPARRAVVRAAP